MNQNEIPVITVDGPSGAGKGTLCQLLAEKLQWHLLDSGAIYRVLAVAAAKRNIPEDQVIELSELAGILDVAFPIENGQVQIILDRNNFV